MTKDTKKKNPMSIANLKQQIEKEYGEGSVMIGKNSIVKVDTFPTRVASIDQAFGCGGIPQGRILEVYGMESSGKTTTCLQFIKACQQHYFPDKVNEEGEMGRKGVVAFIDAEHALDPTWVDNIGVDRDNLILCQPDSGEQAFNILEQFVESGLVDLVVVDSVAAMVPESILNGDFSDANIGAQAKMMSKGLGRIKSKCNKTKCTVVFINQVRMKIGVTFGNPEDTPGGKALKFYSSVRIQINKGSQIKINDEAVGFSPTAKFVKNKVGPPLGSASFDICFGKPARPVSGIDELESLLAVGSDLKIVRKNGNFYWVGETNLGNGMSNALESLRDNQELADDLRQQIYGSLVVKTEVLESEEEEEFESDSLLDGDD